MNILRHSKCWNEETFGLRWGTPVFQPDLHLSQSLNTQVKRCQLIPFSTGKINTTLLADIVVSCIQKWLLRLRYLSIGQLPFSSSRQSLSEMPLSPFYRLYYWDWGEWGCWELPFLGRSILSGQYYYHLLLDSFYIGISSALFLLFLSSVPPLLWGGEENVRQIYFYFLSGTDFT